MMRRKLGTTEMLALLAAAGVTTCAAQAAKIENGSSNAMKSLQVSEQPARTQLAKDGKDMACGKGSCGTDETGAKAAASKHAKDAKAAGAKTPAEKAADKKKEEKKPAG